MVGTLHPHRLLRFRNRRCCYSFSSLSHARRAVLTVKGLAYAAPVGAPLDGSGPAVASCPEEAEG
jgi:hypothetical protein